MEKKGEGALRRVGGGHRGKRILWAAEMYGLQKGLESDSGSHCPSVNISYISISGSCICPLPTLYNGARLLNNAPAPFLAACKF